jgi:hypothetical protein
MPPVAQWLKHCATNREVAGSIPDGVIGIFDWHSPSARTMTLGSTPPLTEMSTENISWGKGSRCVGLTTLPPSCADCLKISKPKPPRTLRACQGLQWDCFTFNFTLEYKIVRNYLNMIFWAHRPHTDPSPYALQFTNFIMKNAKDNKLVIFRSAWVRHIAVSVLQKRRLKDPKLQFISVYSYKTENISGIYFGHWPHSTITEWSCKARAGLANARCDELCLSLRGNTKIQKKKLEHVPKIHNSALQSVLAVIQLMMYVCVYTSTLQTKLKF